MSTLLYSTLCTNYSYTLHTNTHTVLKHRQLKRKLNAGTHGQKHSFCLLTLRLYISVFLTVSCLSLSVYDYHLHRLTTGKHSWASFLLSLISCSISSLSFCLTSLSPPLAAMMIYCCKNLSRKTCHVVSLKNLKGCFAAESQTFSSLCFISAENIQCLIQRAANLFQQSLRPRNYLLGCPCVDVYSYQECVEVHHIVLFPIH